jgi:hypothetical protein
MAIQETASFQSKHKALMGLVNKHSGEIVEVVVGKRPHPDHQKPDAKFGPTDTLEEKHKALVGLINKHSGEIVEVAPGKRPHPDHQKASGRPKPSVEFNPETQECDCDPCFSDGDDFFPEACHHGSHCATCTVHTTGLWRDCCRYK